MLRSVAATSTSSSVSPALTSSSTTSAVSSVLSQSFRFIRKQHNYRHERWARQLKSRQRYSRQWDLGYYGAVDNHKVTGHELEAFENFGVYEYDARKDPNYEVATKDLKLLEPRERHGVLLGMLEKASRVSDGRGIMRRLRLTVLCAECFEDICKFDTIRSGNSRAITVGDLDDNEQFQFRNAVKEVIRLVSMARHDHPDSVAAGMRVVQVCANVGVKLDERRRMMDTLRGYIEEMDEGYMPQRMDRAKTSVDTDPTSELARHYRKILREGTQLLYPPQGRGEDPNTAVPVKVLPDTPKITKEDLAFRANQHRQELKNYRYLHEQHENGKLFKNDPMTRLPFEHDQ